MQDSEVHVEAHVEVSRIRALGWSIDIPSFLKAFSRGHPVVYYRGASLAEDVERDETKATRGLRDWIWWYVIDGGRGTFVQRRIKAFKYEYLAIPFRRETF